MCALAFGVGNRRQKCDFGAARIEPRVLHDDRNVGYEYRGIVGVARDRLRVVKIIKAQVQRAACGDGHAVRADRLAVGEENGNRDARVTLPGVENASGLVGDQRAVGKGAFGGNVTFGDCPSPASNGLHAVPPFFPPKMITRTARFSFRAAGTFFSVRRRGVVNRVLPGSGKMLARESAASAPAATAIRGNPRAVMRAITVSPGTAHSARLEEVPEPPETDGSVLVRTWALGVCGTDREILDGRYGFAPPGQQRLVLGHESLGAVEAAPEGCGLAPGDLVVGVVRRPDPVPCVACAAGEWDMCRNGRYTERGIKERHGYGAERFRIEPEFAIKIDPALGILGVLLEPASILAKAWDHTERIGHRAHIWKPKV